MVSRYILLGTAGSTLVALMAANGASAQSGSPTPPAPISSSAEIPGEIIVTAQKRGENINSVGMAITANTGAQLMQKGVTSVADLTKIEPSLQFSKSQTGTPVYTLRGIGYFEQSLSATPTVSLYEDEVPFAFPVLSRGIILDPERVEILKGPQGTLYGQNATGGAVNFIAAKPTSTFHMGFDESLERFNDSLTSGFISGPLTSTLNARLSASNEIGGAWQKSVTRPDDSLGDKDTQIVRLLLDWKPAPRFKASLNLNGWWDHSETQAGQLEGFRFQDPGALQAGSLSDPAFYFPAAPGSATYNAYPAAIKSEISEPVAPNNARAADWVAGTTPRNNEKFYQAALRLDYELTDTIGLTSLTSYLHFKEDNLIDPTGDGFEPVQTDEVTGRVSSVYQELRVHGTIGSRGHWLVGANYSRDKSHEVDNLTIAESLAYAATALGLPPNFGFGAINSDTATTKAIYANADYHVLDSVDLHGGVRYTKSDQSLDGCSTSTYFSINALQTAISQQLAAAAGGTGGVGVPGQCVTLGPAPNYLPGNVHNNLNEHNVPWRVGIDWTPMPHLLVYGTVSKGYKAGSSPALGASLYTQLTPVTQESLLSYEAGVKAELFDRTLQINLAAFHYDYRDKQQLGRIQDPVYGSVQTLLNIPRSKEDGGEASITWRPIRGITLNGAATYLRSKVTKTFFNSGPYPLGPTDDLNFKGQSFPYTPKWSTQAGARYDWRVSDRFKAFVSADGSYQTKSSAAFGYQEAESTGSPPLVIKAYALLNLTAGFGPANDRWRLELFGKNVTNTYYWNSVNYIADTTTRFAGLPATYGARFSVRY